MIARRITPISSAKNIYDRNSDELNDTDEEEVNVCDTCGVQGFTNKLVICDNYGMGESGFRKQNELITQKSSETVGLDLNIEPNLNLNPNIDLNRDPSIDLNVNPNLDLNLDMTLDPNLDLSVDNNLDLSLDCGSYYQSSSTSNFQAHTRIRTSSNPLLGQGSLKTTCGYTTQMDLKNQYFKIISMVSITHKDDQIVESKEITPISSPKNTYETNSDELNDTDEEENLRMFPKDGLAMTVLRWEKVDFLKQNDLSTQKSSETVNLDLNIEPNLNLNPNIDLNVNPNLDLNLDTNLDPNLDLSVDNNLDLSLDCGSSNQSSSTSNF
ncbi:hypothetical protein YC2023_040372 [Brassica napus]